MFFKKEGDTYVANLEENQELVYIIPEEYFGSKSAIIIGEFVNLVGIFNYAIYTDGKPGTLATFKFPITFLCQPYEIEKKKDIKLTKTTDRTDYRFLKFKNGDKLIVEEKVPQLIENIEEFLRLFVISGKFPTTISYNTMHDYFLQNVDLVGRSYNINAQNFGILTTEICRDPDNPMQPFRWSNAKKKKEWTNYRASSVKEAPNYTSPYVSLTSEYYDDSVIQATMMDEKDVKNSPLEKVFFGQ